QADGSYLRNEISDGTFFSSHTARTVDFSTPLLFSNASSILRDTQQVELTGDSVSTTETPRSILQLVSPVSVVPFTSGGNQRRSGPEGAKRAFDVLGARYTGLDYGENFETIAGQDWMDDPFTGQPVPRTDGFRVILGKPTFQSRTVTHTHGERTFAY